MRLILALIILSSKAYSAEDGFEPFADYSEFVEASTEETDVNFFKYGRLLGIGASFGQKTLTGGQRRFVDDSFEFGAFIAFYMTINFAFQAGYKTSSHDVFYEVPTIDENFSGTFRYENFFIHAKYTLKTQNLTRTIAKFNPYVIGGISQFYRETKTPQHVLISAKDGAGSFDFGAGIEKLFNHNKNFVGLQFMYHYVDFPNENNAISVTNPISGVDINTGLKSKGDLWNINLNIGFNF